MTARPELLEAVRAGRVTADEAAAVLGEDVERVARAVAVLDRLAAGRRRRWLGRLATVAAVLAIAAVGRSWAQSGCPQTLPFPLVTFCADAPARADDVNANFGALAQVVTSRVGPLDGGAAAFSGSTLTVSGGATVGATLNAAAVNTIGAATFGGSATVGGTLAVTGPIHAGCPTTFPLLGGTVNMTDLGASCVMNEHNAALARNTVSWVETTEYCTQRGLRLCHPAELVAAARLSRTRTYTWAEGDYWAWVGQTASDSNASGFGGCHVNLNTNQPGVPLGDINCAIDAFSRHPSIAGLCCI